MESQFLCLRRLVSSKAGFVAFTELPGFRVKLGQNILKGDYSFEIIYLRQ